MEHGPKGMVYYDDDKAEAFADALEFEGRLNEHDDNENLLGHDTRQKIAFQKLYRKYKEVLEVYLPIHNQDQPIKQKTESWIIWCIRFMLYQCGVRQSGPIQKNWRHLKEIN